jgi:hypothetical protein
MMIAAPAQGELDHPPVPFGAPRSPETLTSMRRSR